jgi:ABC-type transport system involved in multi-copper enzyme maturation permease subunit
MSGFATDMPPRQAPVHDSARPRPFAATIAVAAFQLGRLSTRPRLALAAAGTVFPAAVMLAVLGTAPIDRDMAVVMIYALVPEALCMLGLLVTMCPAVADELERGTWIHVAIRPHGRRSLLVGTYLAAVIWTGGVATVATFLVLAACELEGSWRLGGMFLALSLLSCAGRAALFSLPAVIVPRRALVASVGLALIVEFLAGFLPAVVNQATVSLRLRSLLVEWMGWRRKLPVEMQLFVDGQPAWVQVGAVVLLSVGLVALSVAILGRRQFPPSVEG